MKTPFVSHERLPEASFWDKLEGNRPLMQFETEVTARCNNDCRHCYINLPGGGAEAKSKELTLDEINAIADEAVSMGAIWCLLTGGEPLLRDDFADIYVCLKRKGLLVSVFTNANLITEEHVRLFQEYPPRDVEVSVYGVTRETYEAVTRRPGSFDTFTRGLSLLLDNGVKVRLKAMALRSNVHELPQISAFCRERTKDYFRFDPWLHCRYDRNEQRNEEIRSERLSAEEFVAAEKGDDERYAALTDGCDKLLLNHEGHEVCNHIFHCGAGNGSFTVSYDGIFRLCSSLWHPDCIYDLRKGTLSEAWFDLVPQVQQMHTDRREFLERCRPCSIVNLCLWCPAHSHLETGEMDTPVEYFCEVAHARARMLGVDT